MSNRYKNGRLKPFNPNNWDWYSFLRTIKNTKEKYFEEASDKAGSWVTCACGQLCSALPKDGTSERPSDYMLYRLGETFSIDIDNKDWYKAKQTLDKIESRSTLLLNLLQSSESK